MYNEQTTPATDELSQLPQIDQVDRIAMVEKQLLTLVDSCMEHPTAIPFITEALENLLVNPTTELSLDYYKEQMHSALRLIDFLVEIREEHQKWVSMCEINRLQKEVSHD